MQQPRSETPIADVPAGTVLRLRVRNHPGVMSHVCGLFARRAFNVEGIACLPLAGGAHSVVLLLLRDDGRSEQMLRQLRKLEDVLEAEQAPATAAALFATVATHLEPGAPAPL
jgi:acetolactate synthase-1/3 small subunit